MKPVTVVTGATGYLGQALCEALVQQQWQVRRCSRSASVSGDDIAWFRDDPENQVADNRLFDEVDTVFHLAGLAHQHHSISAQAYTSANVEYTRSVATRASHAGVRQVIFVSSVAAVTNHTTDSPVTPNSEPAPQTAYGKSKLAAEQVIRDTLDPTPTDWTVVRPPLIYGSNPKGNLKPLLRLARLPLPLPFGAIENKRSMVSLNNLIDLLMFCAQPGFSGSNRVLMPSDVSLSTAELITALRAANGRSPGLFQLPMPLYEWLVKVPGLGRRAQVLRTSLQVDDPWLRSVGWKAPFGASEQIRAMAVGAS